MKRTTILATLILTLLYACQTGVAQLPKVYQPVQENPDLPRVLIIGDSISIGYTLDVRAKLDGVANVQRPPTNCGPTSRGIADIDEWLGDRPYDVIHFNFGLHDLKYIDDKGGLVDADQGTQQIPIEQYAKNLEQMVKQMKQTGAKLIFATTTPCPEGSKGRMVGDSIKYNAAALKVMKANHVAVNDLYSFCMPQLSEIQREANVHFFPEGSAKLGDEVVKHIKQALSDKKSAKKPAATSAIADGIVMRVVMLEDQDGDPTATGNKAGEQLLQAMGDTQLKAVFVSECFEDREYKDELLDGLKQSLPAEKIFGGATYGSFTQAGCTDFDAVCLWGIGGPGIDVATSLVTEMGTSKLSVDENEQLIKERLHTAGQKLTDGIKRTENDQLLIVFGDAHSPKVQYLVEGVQKVVGPEFPITGGCANKNAGQTFTYYKGEVYEDAAIALMLSGDFSVTQSGRQANECEAVIRSAREGAAEALAQLDSNPPIFVTAFNCAGRRSKLDEYETELKAIQSVIGDLPMFGCYNAGEIGPIDDPDWPRSIRCGGSGWHLMYTIFYK